MSDAGRVLRIQNVRRVWRFWHQEAVHHINTERWRGHVHLYCRGTPHSAQEISSATSLQWESYLTLRCQHGLASTVQLHCVLMSSVLSRCWLRINKSFWPVQNWVMRCWRGYLSGVRSKWFACGPVRGKINRTALPSSTVSWTV